MLPTLSFSAVEAGARPKTRYTAPDSSNSALGTGGQGVADRGDMPPGLYCDWSVVIDWCRENREQTES